MRIGIVGDSGVGKTTFVQKLCKIQNKDIEWTVGCSMEIYQYRSECIEILDIGGASKYTFSRRVLYQNLDGVLYMYDKSNQQSYRNIKKWIRELHTNVPQMIVANKKDLNCKKAFNPMMDYKMEYIETSGVCGQLEESRIHFFLDRVLSKIGNNSELQHRNRI